MKETITPHKISIMILIRVFGEMKLSYHREKQNRTPGAPSADAISADELMCNPRFRRNYNMLMLKLIQGPDMTMKELYTLIITNEDNLFPEFFENFHKHILSIVRLGIEGLLELISRVNLLMMEPTHVLPIITKTSVLGLYIRRTVVMFEKLSISSVVEVFKLFKAYQGVDQKPSPTAPCPSIADDDEDEPMIQGTPFKTPQSALKIKDNSGSLWTRRQAELFIAQQSSLILKNEATAMSPVELHSRIQQLLKANPDCSEAYFLAYLNFLRLRDFTGALHSLYQCFDRGAGFHVDPKQGVPVPGTTEDKARSFRYGALNLAMFYAKFGHKKEAMLALTECIMLAHGASCNFCLQHALCWLYRLSDDNKELLMERSISRGNELSLSYLSSLGIQSLAQHAAFTRKNPGAVFEILSKSDILNCQHSMLDLAANSYALKSSLWTMYGHPVMSSLHAQLLLHSEAQEYSGEAACLALCEVATHLMSEGEHQLCASLLWHVRTRFPQISTQRVWICCEQVLGFSHSMYQGLWQDARRCAEQMAACDQWESRLRLAELQLEQGDSYGALEKVQKVIEFCADNTHISPSLHLRATVVLARVLKNTPTAGAKLLVNAIGIANTRHLSDLNSLVNLEVAKRQMDMGLVTQASHMLNLVMLAVLSHGGLLKQGEVLLLAAKCRTAAAVREQALESGLEAVSDLLDRAKAKFEKIQAYSQVKEVLILQAMVFHHRNMHNEKFKIAFELRLLDEQIASKMSTHV